MGELQELAFREFESACEQSPACVQTSGMARMRCVRECISPSCYQGIYQSDQVSMSYIHTVRDKLNIYVA
jgi:hypothetical protein